MRILELFSGYGTASFALKQLGIDFEIIGYSDIDKYANEIFWNNHWKNVKPLRFTNKPPRELGDVKEIDPNTLEDFDLLTGGFPCQAFSVAGKMLGELDTRGTLFNEIIRIAAVKKPRYMLLENVKGLLSKRHEKTFKKILSELRRIGYHVHWKVLNTKEHGIPQNRERIFIVCFRDHDEWFNFQYPRKEELKIFLKDILEGDVDEKYYLSQKQVDNLKQHCGKKNKINEELMKCIGVTEEGESSEKPNKALMIGNLSRYKMKSERSMPFKEDGISWALTGDCGVGVLQLDISNIRREGTPRVYEDVSRTLNTAQGGGHTPLILASRGRYNKEGKVEQNLEPKTDGTTNSITTVQKDNYLLKEYKLRKLTPTECFRLQGFLNDEVDLDGISDSQQYKLAGNGQSVNVVKKIFERMFR